MTTALFEHGDPWTEEEFLALGETHRYVELFDGSLLVSPAPTPEHQDLSRHLANTLDRPAAAAGLKVYLAVNVRLKLDRVPIPDLVLVDRVDPREAVIDVASVRLISEIVSPSSPSIDRLLKMEYYAEAGIPWYLLVEPRPELTLRLFRLDGEGYTLHGEGRPGAPLRLTEPVAVELDPETLAR